MTDTREELTKSVVIRLADGDDAELLEVLAALDSARRPVDPVLIAERGGQPVAALGLNGGEVIANPFLRTIDVVDLLRLRARQIQPTGSSGRRLFRSSPASGKPVGDARNRLHRLLEGAHMPV